MGVNFTLCLSLSGGRGSGVHSLSPLGLQSFLANNMLYKVNHGVLKLKEKELEVSSLLALAEKEPKTWRGVKA